MFIWLGIGFNAGNGQSNELAKNLKKNDEHHRILTADN